MKNETPIHSVKNLIKRWIIPPDYRDEQWKKDFPYLNTPEEKGCNFNSTTRVGIAFDKSYSHKYYINACLSKKISYVVIDLFRNDWVEQLKKAEITVLFVWPYSTDRIVRELYQSRSYLIKNHLRITLVPGFHESWFYENKLKLADFLKVKGYNHPDTFVFYREQEALNFLESTQYPIVFKTDIGAVSSGVRICKTIGDARKLVKKCFGRQGYINYSSDIRDKQWGYVIFQEFIPNAKEWRMVRIGDSVMCRIKGKIGEYHSGSGKVEWGKPSEKLLNLFWNITENENYRSINVDFFENDEGDFLINEIHAVFGEISISNVKNINDFMGRYLKSGDEWKFENGYFYDNACADLRITEYLKQLNLK